MYYSILSHANTHDPTHEAPCSRAVGKIEADRHGLGPEIRSLRLTASLSMTPSLKVCHLWTLSQKRLQRLQGRGEDESTVNMRVFLASEDHRLVYNDLRGMCNETSRASPLACFCIFESLHPNTGAMMLGPEWLILSYHVPNMSAFLPEVDHEDEARRRKHETTRTMATAKKMRH
eukprot:jgi/Tetstr1/466351/TSEL_010881.t1